jgi:hypothetical protein
MANRKLTSMSASAVPVATDLMYLVKPGDGDPDRKVTVDNLRKAVDIKSGGSTKITIIENITNITIDETELEIVDEDGNRLSIADDTAMSFDALFVARRTDANNESAGYKISGVIDRNAGTVALVGPVLDFTLAEDSNWTVEARADNVNKALAFFVTGESGKTIKWSGIVTTVKVTG